MALGMTTIKIQRARIAYLTAENTRLRRELEKYRRACDVSVASTHGTIREAQTKKFVPVTQQDRVATF
jgi:hypothetical protein